ncbi:SRPBCC domain-containing protein [Phenylobacterium sp.]|jgi:uncharacterized protein YndB with AHSA1/START domain|uniref:SRPBCC family protein n=1 Tax=Phenylobacterium sp. TaxID=1871053 RepID=UPI002E305EEB|nr:SRPBCC domain-containing protein [Phenylobacterium sp.]HEX4708980.1 SRPBCC domain-containing protein [Phenylobacterium sp.]
MSNAAAMADTHNIVVDEVFPHTPEVLWKTLTTGELISRWLMTPNGFEPTEGNHFTFQTPPDGEWDGVIRCEVLEVRPNERLVYAWRTGNQTGAGYVPRLDTVVTWTLNPVDGGARLRLVHSGFLSPKNDAVFRNISEGWPKLIQKLRAVVGEQDASKSETPQG